MSMKSKAFAAATALTLLGGAGMAGALSAGTASAATPSCGGSCAGHLQPPVRHAPQPELRA